MTTCRRRYLSTIAAGGCLLSGCVSLPSAGAYEFRKGGLLRTDEPLLVDTGISSQKPYPYQYGSLITTERDGERVRWNYFREQDPVFAEKFAGTDFERGFLTFAGLVLPKSNQLESGTSTVDGSTIHSTYRVLDGAGTSEQFAVQTVVEYWDRTAEPPSDFAVSYKFEVEPSAARE